MCIVQTTSRLERLKRARVRRVRAAIRSIPFLSVLALCVAVVGFVLAWNGMQTIFQLLAVSAYNIINMRRRDVLLT